MNKKNKQIVPLVFLVSILVFVGILYLMVNQTWLDYNDAKVSAEKNEKELTSIKEKYDKSKELKKQEEIQLQSIKQVYQTNVKNSNDSLGMFGDMFEDLIKRAQYNGLLIRSIEYQMNPTDDVIYSNFADQYNVCELKFFLVGSYAQLRTFLNEITTNFKYLLSVSKLNVTAFSENTDYILIKLSVTLYSKKPSKEDKDI